MTDIPLSNILFVDIETASGSADYNSMDERLQSHWDRKAGFLKNPEELESADLYFERAGIYAEFGKVLTIAVGYLTQSADSDWALRVKAFASDNEHQVLLEFKDLLETGFEEETLRLCAHNGKEFDFPYICRRMLIQNIPLPGILNISNKKPWELPFIDTMDLWKFGDRKSFTSLDLLATLFDIRTSKEDIDGSMVNQVYYREGGLERIASYCKRDIIVTAQLYLKLKSLPPIKENNITLL